MKRLKKEDRNREKNRKYKSLIKRDLKLIKSLSFNREKITEKDFFSVRNAISLAQKHIDQSVTKKVIHKNNASRKKSNLFSLLNSLKIEEKIN